MFTRGITGELEAPTKLIVGDVRVNNHKNVHLTVFGRQLLVQRILEQGLRVEEAAHAAGVSSRTAYKWLTRYRQEGPEGLYNRSSRPASCPHAIDDQR